MRLLKLKKKEKSLRKKIKSPAKRKALLLLQAGIALSLTPSPRMQSYIFKQLSREWREVDKQYLYRIIKEFYHERLIDWKENSDGSVSIVLTEEGKERALQYKIDEIEIKIPKQWDNKWRIVFFDIPEKRRAARDALRRKLKEIGFYEMQKSVFVHPFYCKDEVDFLIEFFDIRPFVRYAEVINITNEAQFKIQFNHLYTIVNKW
jgi:hypothetical protein